MKCVQFRCLMYHRKDTILNHCVSYCTCGTVLVGALPRALLLRSMGNGEKWFFPLPSIQSKRVLHFIAHIGTYRWFTFLVVLLSLFALYPRIPPVASGWFSGLQCCRSVADDRRHEGVWHTIIIAPGPGNYSTPYHTIPKYSQSRRFHLEWSGKTSGASEYKKTGELWCGD